jgi:hypothetical protein
MQGKPEGTEHRGGGRRPKWLVVLVLVFAAYLAFRLVQGIVWLIGQV